MGEKETTTNDLLRALRPPQMTPMRDGLKPAMMTPVPSAPSDSAPQDTPASATGTPAKPCQPAEQQGQSSEK